MGSDPHPSASTSSPPQWLPDHTTERGRVCGTGLQGTVTPNKKPRLKENNWPVSSVLFFVILYFLMSLKQEGPHKVGKQRQKVSKQLHKLQGSRKTKSHLQKCYSQTTDKPHNSKAAAGQSRSPRCGEEHCARHGSAFTLLSRPAASDPPRSPARWTEKHNAQARTTRTYLGLPLPPEASSPSEGRHSALGAHTGSCDDGYMLRFGKDFAEFSHICMRGRRTSSNSDTWTLVPEATETVLANVHIQTGLPQTPPVTSGTDLRMSSCTWEFERQLLETPKNAHEQVQ